jgi:hypothetical protein
MNYVNKIIIIIVIILLLLLFKLYNLPCFVLCLCVCCFLRFLRAHFVIGLWAVNFASK